MKFLKQLTENFGIDYPGHQEDQSRPYDRAIDMINAAVEYHTDNNTFDKIADVEGIVDFLRGRYPDFSQQIEQNVRDIIADEMDTTPQEQNSDEFYDQDTSPEQQEYEEEKIDYSLGQRRARR